jgi:hypothetical protein
MISGVLQGAREIKAVLGLPNNRYCAELKVPYSSFMRWQSRERNAEPLLNAPGPRKVEPFHVEKLKQEVEALEHRRKLSFGTGELYQKYSSSISRRDLSEMVRAAREEATLNQRMGLKRVDWHVVNLAWSMDDLDCDIRDDDGGRFYANRMQDLASKYKFDPLSGEYPCGEAIAGYLKAMFDQYGAPLILKRDNRGNLNHPAVNDILSDYFVLPLNSPPYYAQYNGSIEESQGEFIKGLAKMLSPDTACPKEHFRPYADDVEHHLNHRPRPCLGGRTSCQVYYEGKDKRRFSKRERRETYDWTIALAGDILEGRGGDGSLTFDSAWRIAIEIWLKKKGYITVTSNRKVSLTYS